ncbi:MAG: transposase [Desulfovibrio sp.]|nr:transposase [Desulfovibrio sp.]
MSIEEWNETFRTFPLNVNNTKQCGETFWMPAVFLYLFFKSPYRKIHAFLFRLTGTKRSAARACNNVKTLAKGMSARKAVKKIKSRLMQESVVLCDETGVRAEVNNARVHTTSTHGLTYETAFRSRRVRGMIGPDFLPHFDGILVNDCRTPY